jgi:hypothetical protein
MTMVNGMPLSLRGRVAWAHDWVSNPVLGAVFQTLPGASFTVFGATPPAQLGAGLGGREIAHHAQLVGGRESRRRLGLADLRRHRNAALYVVSHSQLMCCRKHLRYNPTDAGTSSQ